MVGTDFALGRGVDVGSAGLEDKVVWQDVDMNPATPSASDATGTYDWVELLTHESQTGIFASATTATTISQKQSFNVINAGTTSTW